MAKRGRPTMYSPKFPAWARALARRGLSDKDIAREMDIARSTLIEWKNTYAEFADALTEGKGQADALVENALYKRAVGYDFEEVKVICTPDHRKVTSPAKAPQVTKIEKVTKHIPPDISAIALWLKNRMPNDWREKTSVEVEGEPVNVNVNLSALTKEELIELEKTIAKIESS